jgi:putative ABC transport system ATP-binding protein
MLRDAVDEHGQTIIMVTHDASAAAYADRVVFMVDGKVVRELREPTRDSVLDAMKEITE